MKLLKYINESFDKPYPFDWRRIPHDNKGIGFRGSFKSSKHTIEVALTPDLDKENEWELFFFIKNKDISGNFDLTNDGDAFRIFATVIAMTNDALDIIQKSKKLSIDTLFFTASKEKSDNEKITSDARSKLYVRIVKKLIKPKNIRIVDLYDKTKFYIII